jgi:hypothetical protein
MDYGGAHREEPSRVRPFLSDEPEPEPYREEEPDDPGPRPSDVSHLRPYLLTGGRTRPSSEDTLEIEAQVVTTDTGYLALSTLEYEQRDIVELCRTPMAVAEIAARLRLHLGVARVLVGDLLGLGHLAVRRPDTVFQRSTDIIQRVIRGLQAID